MSALATTDDVVSVWRAFTGPVEEDRVADLIEVASAKLRQRCPFNIDARIALFAAVPTDLVALNPKLVANVVANIVKRFLVNPDGVVTATEGVGPYSRSQSYVNRYDKTGSDVRGVIQVIESDIEELKPSIPTRIPKMIQLLPTAAMQPASGWWPRFMGPVDQNSGEPLYNGFYGFGDGFEGQSPAVPAADPTIVSGSVIAVYTSTSVTFGREMEVLGQQTVVLTIPVTTVTGATFSVTVSQSYSGGGVIVSGSFATGPTTFAMTSGMQKRFIWGGAGWLVI